MSLTAKGRVAGVMGWPVGHSRSPRLHGHWLAHYGVDGAYVPMAVPPDRIGEALRALSALGFAGCNVTLPHKEAAFAAMDVLDDAARRMGAVNTVVVLPDGRLSGGNTDGFGFMENLRHGAPDWRADAGPAVVIGAGGAARAIIVALLDAGAPEVRLTNRTASRAETLRTELASVGLAERVTVADWVSRETLTAEANLLVNTTTQGVTGQPALDLKLDWLPPSALVTDAVYTPLKTPLLAAARARGNRVVDGLGMLLHQARPGFKTWFGVEPEVTAELRAAVLAG
jgi:shikimate dehydrogenase